MVAELRELIETGELYSDVCDHLEPSDNEGNPCAVCFITNCFDFLDPNDPEEELSEKQIKWIHDLYARYCDGELPERD